MPPAGARRAATRAQAPGSHRRALGTVVPLAHALQVVPVQRSATLRQRDDVIDLDRRPAAAGDRTHRLLGEHPQPQPAPHRPVELRVPRPAAGTPCTRSPNPTRRRERRPTARADRHVTYPVLTLGGRKISGDEGHRGVRFTMVWPPPDEVRLSSVGSCWQVGQHRVDLNRRLFSQPASVAPQPRQQRGSGRSVAVLMTQPVRIRGRPAALSARDRAGLLLPSRGGKPGAHGWYRKCQKGCGKASVDRRRSGSLLLCLVCLY
jgi:hypothetical protein